MKKSTKLLSVILAIVMLFSSMTVMASAAKTSYQSHQNLADLQAYSPYGAVTRLSTEERTSILFDYLDQLLADLNINPGELFSLGNLSLSVNLTSVNALCGTVDNVKNLLDNGLVSMVSGLLGVIKDVNLDNWQPGMTRDGTAQLTIVAELLEVLRDNAGVVGNVLRTGNVDLGVASSALSGVDLSVIGDIPGLIKGLIFPLLERKDDDLTQMGALTNTQGPGNVQTVLNSFVQSLFTKPQSTTSYKEDASGKCISNHTLPTTDDYYRYAYAKGTDSIGQYYTCYVLDPVTYEYTPEAERFYRTEEPAGSGEYVYKTASGDNLKYYENGSYWLPSFANALNTGAETLDLNTDTATTLLYKFAPYVFEEMAPVVLNGSVKKALAEWFGAKFTYVGDVGSEEVNALPDSKDVFFTQEQGEYLWEWSDYKVINGNHYYRFQDQIFSSDLSNTNPYFDIIKWDFKITGDFLNEFVPTAETNGNVTASAAGYTTVLAAANDFLGKVISTVFTPEVVSAISWTKGGNDQLLENAKKAARYVVSCSPESIFGEDYNNGYYQLMMDESSSNQEIVCGIAAKLIELLMPQFNLPSAENLKGKNVGGLLAAIIRELATQLLPTYNYDALIYSDYNHKILLDKDNSYWLDVCLTMGVDIGMSYLRNLADLGEDQTDGYKFADSKTYDLAAFEQNPQAWEATVDWIVDWALSDDYEWTWKMEKFINTNGLTINLGTTEDPWPKLDAIIRAILPVEEILSVTPAEGKTWLETALRDNFVLSLLNLDIVTPVSMFNIPAGSVLRDTNVFSAVVEVVRNLLNGLLTKMAGGDLINASVITSIDSVFNQGNIADFAQNLISKLYTAYQNGLLDVAMPILNFFVGWTTDAQKFNDPSLLFNTGDYSYIYTTGSTATTTLRVTNASAGMLLQHRGSAVTDQNYVLVIDGISGDFTTTQTFPVEVQPYSSANIPLSTSFSGERGVSVTISYHYKLKDGYTLPNNLLEETVYQMVSNETQSSFSTYYDEGYESGGIDGDARLECMIGPQNPLVTSKNSLAAAIAGLTATWKNAKDHTDDFTESTYTGYDSNYIESSGAAEALLGAKINGQASVSIHPARLRSGLDVETIPSGTTFALGSSHAQSHYYNDSWLFPGHKYAQLTGDYGTLYYCDLSDVTTLFEAEEEAGRSPSEYTPDSWATYSQAMKDAAALLLAPVQMDSFSTTYTDTRIDSVFAALEAAVEGLESVETFSYTPQSVLQPVLDSTEPEGQEINYQDYELYEYWDYEEQRTAARDLIAGTTEPEAPDAYIEGNDLSEEEINAVIANEANATLKAAVQKTMLQPTEEEQAAYADAIANWVPASYTALELLDMANKLPYYKQFLIAKTTEKQFLEKEIAAANAQGYGDGSSYSTDSWAAYSAALAYATEVNSDPNALQSEVFNAKYNLMITQNQLMAKEDSAKDNGAYMQLEALIAQADVMFQNATLYTVKEGDAAEAWANLVAALGYEYEGENGDMQNLYANSAKAYVASDRVMSSTTDAQIASQVATLQDAINQFTCSITLVPDEDVPGNDTNVEQSELVINGLVPATINSEEDLLALVEASAPAGYTATLESVASAAGYYGTGATVKVNVAELGGQTVATYTVVIYGDVNGDGAVDAFDAAVLDLDLAGKTALTGAYNLAADTNADAEVAAGDYALVKDVLAGTGTIIQVR